jgi:hypothetical protein
MWGGRRASIYSDVWAKSTDEDDDKNEKEDF